MSHHATPKRSKIGCPKRKKKPSPHGDTQLGSSSTARTTIKPVCTTNKLTNGEVNHCCGVLSEPSARKPQAHPAKVTESAKNQRDLLQQLFIELNGMDGTTLLVVVSSRNQTKSALELAFEVMDMEATTNNFDNVTADPKKFPVTGGVVQFYAVQNQRFCDKCLSVNCFF